MTAVYEPTQISGVDGCKAGWIAVTAALESFDKPEVKVFASVAALIAELAPRSLIAIDMPIGLPERAIRGGREADWAARQFLGRQRASVFPVPSRRAVDACANGYQSVSIIGQDTSDPPRKPSRQIFGILHRIRQIDEILRQEPVLRERVFEVHPEVSFKVMNNDEPLPERKKVKGRINPNGMQLRKKLLEKEGFPRSFLDQIAPPGAGRDDFYDACACAWSAKRILARKARVFPWRPPIDAEGLGQAIRA
jgi:predicted RNase H-like nuclease